MEFRPERDWTAQIVISFEHAGLKPYAKALEDEIRRVLARVDEPRIVAAYLDWLKFESEKWFEGYPLNRRR